MMGRRRRRQTNNEKKFKRRWHATYDLYFTVRFVTVQPRAFFDSFDTEQVRAICVCMRSACPPVRRAHMPAARLLFRR